MKVKVKKYELIPVPPKCIEIKEGINKNLTVGRYNSGRLRIVDTYDNNDRYIYLLIDTYCEFHNQENGCIKTMKLDGTQIILLGNKARGKFNYYPCALIRVPNDGKRRFIKVELGGVYHNNKDCQYHIIVCEKDNAFMLKNTELEIYFKSIKEEMPIELNNSMMLFNDMDINIKDAYKLYIDKNDDIIYIDDEGTVINLSSMDNMNFMVINSDNFEENCIINPKLNKIGKLSNHKIICCMNKRYKNLYEYLNYFVKYGLLAEN